MNPFEMADYMGKLPREERIKVRKRLLYFAIIVSFLAFIGTGCLEIIKEKMREKAVYLVTSERYSLVCNGVETPLTVHDYMQFTAEDLSEYNAFRFIEETKTVRCTGSGVDLSGFILSMSILLLVGSSAILAITEFMSVPQSVVETKEETTDEK